MSAFSILNLWAITGLLALTVPIIVHLARKDDDNVHNFPSLMFIRRIKVEDRRRRNLRDRFLLLLRLLGIACLVLAFARPLGFMSTGMDSLKRDPSKTVFLVDISGSMSHPEREDSIREILDRRINELGANDHAALVFFDDETYLAQELTNDRSAIRSAAASLKIGVGRTGYAQAFRAARDLLKSNATNQRVVLISDLQQTGIDGDGAMSLPADVELEIENVDVPLQSNVAVNGIEKIKDKLQISVSNTGAIATPNFDITVSIGDDNETLTVSALDAGQQETLTATLSAASPEAVLVEAKPDRNTDRAVTGITSDDLHTVVFAPRREINVLVVSNEERSRGLRSRPRSFVSQALSLADTIAVTDELDRDLTASSFDNIDVVVFDDAALPAGDGARRLDEFLDQGGGLFIVAGETIKGSWPTRFNERFPGEPGDLIDATPPNSQGISSFVDYHPISRDLVNSVTGDGALSNVSVTRYRRFNVTHKDDAPFKDHVIATLDDGAPFLFERVSSKGKVMALATTIDSRWSSLGREPGFVRLCHAIVDYLSETQQPRPAYTQKEIIDLARHAGGFAAGGRWRTGLEQQGALIESPSGERIRQEPGRTYFRPTELGIHKARLSGADVSTIAFAVNADPVESTLNTLDVDSFRARMERTAWSNTTAIEESARSSSDTNPIWRWLLVLAAILFIMESLVANRLTVRRQNQVTT